MNRQPHPIKKTHPPTPIGRLLNKYGISLAQLAVCLIEEKIEFSSRSTLHRMVHGQLSEQMAEYLHPPTARCLSKFLLNRRIDKTEIDAELSRVFTEGEYQPMISKRIALSDAEIKYFGLARDPFKEFPQSRDEVYLSPELREIYDGVIDAIKYRHFVAVIGPIGAGKTTLRSLVEDHVATDDRIKLIWPEFFDQAKVSPIGIARTILRETDARIPGRTEDVGRAVKNKLASLTQNGKCVGLAFDECHKMNKDAVRSLKNFFEMSSGGFQKYLGIVLFGWPEFVSTLEMPEFQEIYERIHVLEMPDFRSSAAGYLDHRLQLAGTSSALIFDQDAIDLIVSQSETPLGLGNIANEAMRISMRDFGEPKVIGAAIRTKMHFESRTTAPAFRRR